MLFAFELGNIKAGFVGAGDGLVVFRKASNVVALLVTGLHALALWAVVRPHDVSPVLQLPTLQGVLIAAPPVETSRPSVAPVAPPPPMPVKRVEKAPPKVAVKPRPQTKTKTPPTKQARAPSVQQQTPTKNTAQSNEAPVASTAEAKVAVSAPVVPPRVDARQQDNPAPAYPRMSRRRGEEGEVMLQVLILPNGAVGEIRVKTSSGYARLDDAALEAVKQWRYIPAHRGNQPISYWYLQPIVFALNR